MKKLSKSILGKSVILLSLFLTMLSCEKVDEGKNKIPAVSFETALISVNTEAGQYDAVVNLTEPAQNNLIVKLQFSGNAIENEHYTVPAKEIAISQGQTKGTLKITILNENIWDENLELKISLAPSTSYVILPATNSESTIRFTKKIVLPVLSFDKTGTPQTTNPYNGEEITFKLKLDQALAISREVTLSFDGGMTIGQDFMVDGGNSNKFMIPKGATTHTFKIKLNRKDNAGFDKDLKITLTPTDPKFLAISAQDGSYTLKVTDPLVDISPMLRKESLGGNPGFQIYQAIKGVDGTWIGKVTVSSIQNAVKKNYLKTFKHISFNAAFDCMANAAGGDALRLADLLNFATSDTVIADYGVGGTTRFFSPSDSLIRFIASEQTTLKGTLATVSQKFTAKLVLKADWETGTNTNKQWHIDSKATGGDITKSTYPTFATVVIELVKIEGTYDFTLAEPELIFTAWYKSSSKYFMKNMPSTLSISKDGDMYKVNYRLYPRS